MAKLIRLTHERLVEVLDLDPATGIFVWKVARSNRVKVGSRAGVLHQASGGRYISIDNEKFMAHRLAFFYVNKRWPNTDVRPIDGDYDHCAIDNLKEVSRVELAHQRDLVANNTSGFAGVSRAKFDRWQAKITWNYEQIGLGGNFETAEEASAVYEEAARRLKAASTQEDRDRIVSEIRLFKRQRAAWINLTAQDIPLGWPSFEAFAADVTDVPSLRYAIAPIDAAIPIGPGNYRWSNDGEHNTGTVEGRNAYARHNRAVNKDQLRDRDFRKKYGIDYAEYQRMLIAQKGVCAICEQPETKLQFGAIRMLSVDHDHDTKKVRSLLCGNCNMGVGYFCDDVEILRKAIAYLQRHAGQQSNVVPFEPSIVAGTLGSGA